MLPPHAITFTFASTLLLLLSLVRAHPPVERLDELIDGLSDRCVCDEACTTIVETECTDIQCACNLQLQAQQCIVSCERTAIAVDAFNAYLDSCVKESLAIPTATLPVIGITSSAVAYVQTEVQPTLSPQATPAPAQVQAGGAMGYDNAGAGAGAGGGTGAGSGAAAPAVQPAAGTGANWLEVGSANAGGLSTPAAAAVAAATGVQTGVHASGGSLSLTNYNPVNLAAAAPTVGSAGTSGNAGSTSTTAALDATQSYFSQAVSEDCQTPCQCWKDAADACTDDACLCTPDAFKFARECNECVGSSRAGMNARNVGDLPGMPWSGSDDEEEAQDSSRGGNSAQGGSSGSTNPSMGSYYSKFTEACQAKVPGIANGAAGLQQGKSGVEVVPTGGLRYATAGVNAKAGIANAGQPIMLTDTNGRTQYAGGDALGTGARGAGYSTNTVTATAAMYAQETVVVDADSAEDDSSWFSDGASSRQVITWELLLVCVGVSLVIL